MEIVVFIGYKSEFSKNNYIKLIFFFLDKI